jgi:hypothetical protein
MIKVESGKIIYKIYTTYSKEYLTELKSFLDWAGMTQFDLNKIQGLNYLERGFELKHLSFKLTVKKKENQVILLFETEMSPDYFYDLISNHFEVNDGTRQVFS